MVAQHTIETLDDYDNLEIRLFLFLTLPNLFRGLV